MVYLLEFIKNNLILMKYVCFDQDTQKILYDNNDLIYLKSLTPLPTTTTTTTSSGIVDIYYGTSSKTRIIESDILSTFSTAYGYVGLPSGRSYTFSTGYSYKYWCILWEPNTGERVINYVIRPNDPTYTLFAYDSYYRYYQINPTPSQSVTYGIIEINGNWYRIYRTILKSSVNNNFLVYSF